MEKSSQPKIRNWIAVSAWNRKADKHGGTKKQQKKRERKKAKQALRNPEGGE